MYVYSNKYIYLLLYTYLYIVHAMVDDNNDIIIPASCTVSYNDLFLKMALNKLDKC